MNSPLLDKSLDFATQVVLFYEDFSKTKKDTTIQSTENIIKELIKAGNRAWSGLR